MIHSPSTWSCHTALWLNRLLMRALLATAGAVVLSSCTNDAGMYPDIITEFANIHTSPAGNLQEMYMDDGSRYVISNKNMQTHRPDTVYRAVVGFLPEPATASSPAEAFIYTLSGARVLGDSTSIVSRDPVDAASMWYSGPYINMQITALSQGGIQYWGYSVDECHRAGTGGRQHSHYFLSLHHSQGTDPKSYSRTYYSSLLLSSIPDCAAGDTISIKVQTFQGPKTWNFCIK